MRDEFLAESFVVYLHSDVGFPCVPVDDASNAVEFFHELRLRMTSPEGPRVARTLSIHPRIVNVSLTIRNDKIDRSNRQSYSTICRYCARSEQCRRRDRNFLMQFETAFHPDRTRLGQGLVRARCNAAKFPHTKSRDK